MSNTRKKKSEKVIGIKIWLTPPEAKELDKQAKRMKLARGRFISSMLKEFLNCELDTVK